MSDTQHHRPGAHPAIYDQRLPGHYPCLTMQLNLTVYQASEVARMVLVVREPSDQVECFREHFNQMPMGQARELVLEHVASAMNRMQYLQHGTAV